MANSKIIFFVGLLFAVLLLTSSEVSARELGETTTAQTQGTVVEGSVEDSKLLGRHHHQRHHRRHHPPKHGASEETVDTEEGQN